MHGRELLQTTDCLLEQISAASPRDVAQLAHALHDLARREDLSEVADAALCLEKAASVAAPKKLARPLSELCTAVEKLSEAA
jgi:hypothetical protein